MAANHNLAANIRRYQEDLDMICKDFAAYLGVSTSTLSKMRRGDAHFSSHTLERVAAVLGITASDLLSGPQSALQDAVLMTAGALAHTPQPKRDKAWYYLQQLVEALEPGAERWAESGG